MTRSRRAWLFFGLLLWAAAAGAQVQHRLTVTLDPPAHTLAVTDRMTLAAPARRLTLLLHAGLDPQVVGAGAAITARAPVSGRPVPLQRLTVELEPNTAAFTLRYGGKIHHPIRQAGAEYARGFSTSPGLIGPEGVYLAGSSYWLPEVVGQPQIAAHTLALTLPPGWRSMSQGRRQRQGQDDGTVETEIWASDTPQQEIYLIAGAFEEYRATGAGPLALVLLRQPEAALAAKYLRATQQYLELYRELIGPYPYPKFALVENFWETGYGMPSFTLLGPRVIRLPFILHSSYPHEILHNWWGNGVYVDYPSGNWAEGLTSYLADHLIKEQRGQGADYRRQVLQKYADYVRDQEDFPLTAFRARHGAVTEAVGYGKTLMLFHMLRRQLGDPTFIDALRQFYRRYRFKVASFDDLAETFSDAAGRPLGPTFKQWVERRGAPALRVSEARATPRANGFLLTATVEQTQPGEPYQLALPLAVQLADGAGVRQQTVAIDAKRQRLELELPARPLRLELDPEFDVFRRLDRREIPPALSQAFGAARALMVIPAAAPSARQNGYRQLAAAWAQSQDREGQPEVVLDSAVSADQLAGYDVTWLFGWDNRLRPALAAALAAYDVTLADAAVTLDGQRLTRQQHALVLAGRRPDNPDAALVWVAADNAAALPGLARKLPHYGKYGYLAFRGDAPENVVKGEWPVIDSPLSVPVAQADGQAVSLTHPAPLAPRAALAPPLPLFSAERMGRDVAWLAAAERAGRGLGSGELARAADYVAARFEQAGLKPGTVDGSYLQTWTAAVAGLGPAVTLTNVIGVLPGSNPDYAGQSVVLGAHLDHLGRGWPDARAGNAGKIHPGADDNASGVAVMLELARVLAETEPERSIVMVAFTGEEAGRLGSRYYVEQAASYPVDKVIGMINLDTVGRLGDGPLLVLGAGSAREWPHIFRGAGYVTGVPVRPVADDYGASDQASFLEYGVPAVQLFSGPNADYHSPTDGADKIDAEGMVKVAAVAKEALEYLAAWPEPLTPSGAQPQTRSSQPRRALLGTVPDFAFGGPGVRLSGVSPETPADQAGLREGDIVTALDDAAVNDLRGFSELLKSLRPGDRVTIRFRRDGAEQSTVATLTAR